MFDAVIDFRISNSLFYFVFCFVVKWNGIFFINKFRGCPFSGNANKVTEF